MKIDKPMLPETWRFVKAGYKPAVDKDIENAKNPMGQGWQKKAFTYAEATKQLGTRHTGYSLQNGIASKWTVAVDVDGPWAESFAQTLGLSPDLSISWSSNPGHGKYQVAFQMSPEQVEILKNEAGVTKDKKLTVYKAFVDEAGRLHLSVPHDKDDPKKPAFETHGLELRMNASPSVLPPSLHPSGKYYQWIKGPDTPLAPLPNPVLQWAVGIIRRKNEIKAAKVRPTPSVPANHSSIDFKALIDDCLRYTDVSTYEKIGGMSMYRMGDQFCSTCPVHPGSDNKTAFTISFSGTTWVWSCWTRCNQDNRGQDIFAFVHALKHGAGSPPRGKDFVKAVREVAQVLGLDISCIDNWKPKRDTAYLPTANSSLAVKAKKPQSSSVQGKKSSGPSQPNFTFEKLTTVGPAHFYDLIPLVIGEVKFNLLDKCYEQNGSTEFDDWEQAYIDLNVNHNIRIKKALCVDTLKKRAQHHSYHPVVEMLTDAYHNVDPISDDEWDRLAEIYLGAPPKPEYNLFLQKQVLSLVNRAIEPGCEVHQCLVLENPSKGSNKGTFFRTLAGADYSTTIPRFNFDNQTKMYHQLHSSWLVELAEIDRVLKSEKDYTDFQNQLTVGSDSYTPPYGKANKRAKRQFCLVGTTNVSEWIPNPDGERRLPIIHLHKDIPIDLVKRDRLRIFSKAMHLLKTGTPYWYSRDEEQLIINQSKNHVVKDDWLDEIDCDLIHKYPKISTREVLIQVFHLDKKDILKSNLKGSNSYQSHAARCLKALGWTRTEKATHRFTCSDGHVQSATYLWINPRPVPESKITIPEPADKIQLMSEDPSSDQITELESIGMQHIQESDSASLTQAGIKVLAITIGQLIQGKLYPKLFIKPSCGTVSTALMICNRSNAVILDSENVMAQKEYVDSRGFT